MRIGADTPELGQQVVDQYADDEQVVRAIAPAAYGAGRLVGALVAGAVWALVALVIGGALYAGLNAAAWLWRTLGGLL